MRTILAIAFLALVFPISSRAQVRQGFTVEDFSVYSLLPDPSGNRHVAISFRVVNHSTTPAAIPKLAVVAVNQASRRIPFPDLPPGGTAFISDVLATKDLSINISISIENNSIPGHTDLAHVAVAPTLSYTAHLDRAEPGRWQAIGPSKFIQHDGTPIGVGRVTTLAIDPRSADTVYVGARGSGIWKTTDAGANWFPISDSLPSVHIDALAIDPSNPDRVLAASTLGVFQSFDAGTAWTQLTSADLKPWGADGAAFLIGPAPTFALYLCTRKGLQVSVDGGHNWTLVLGGSSPIDSLQFDTADKTILYASIASSPAVGVYIGLNGGITQASWHQLHGCPNSPLPTIPTDSRVWIAQSGNTFEMSFLEDPPGNIRQLWRSSANTCTAKGFTEHGWVNVPIDSTCDSMPKSNSSFLFLHPDSGNLVFKGGLDLCRSNSGGPPIRVDGPHVDQHSIAVAPSNHQVMYLGNDGGIYRSADSGATWRFIAEGLAVTEEISSAAGSGSPFLIMGSQDNGSAIWDGFSPIWKVVAGGDISLVAFDPFDANITYNVGQGLPTDVHRVTGSADQAIGDSSKLPALKCYSEDPSLFCGLVPDCAATSPIIIAAQGLWLGPPWSQLMPSLGSIFNRVVAGPVGIFLAGTTDGRVVGGTNPSAMPLLLQTNPISTISSLAFASDTTFYASTQTQSGKGRLYRMNCQTDDSGALTCSNLDLSQNLPVGEIMAILPDPNLTGALLVSIRAQGVFRGTPGPAKNGLLWSSFNNGLPDGLTVTDMSSPVNSKTVFLATWGRGTFAMLSTAPLNPSTAGHVKSFRQQRLHPGQPPGGTNPLLTFAVMDSCPVSTFSASNLGGPYVTILKNAVAPKRLVSITYQPVSATSGTILSVH